MRGGKPFQSKLTPFYELIQQLRKAHTPYPEIARRLHEEHGLKVSASTIFEFVKVRARRSGVFALPELPSAAPVSSPPAISEAHGTPRSSQAKARAADGHNATTPAAPAPTGRKAGIHPIAKAAKPLHRRGPGI